MKRSDSSSAGGKTKVGRGKEGTIELTSDIDQRVPFILANRDSLVSAKLEDIRDIDELDVYLRAKE